MCPNAKTPTPAGKREPLLSSDRGFHGGQSVQEVVRDISYHTRIVYSCCVHVGIQWFRYFTYDMRAQNEPAVWFEHRFGKCFLFENSQRIDECRERYCDNRIECEKLIEDFKITVGFCRNIWNPRVSVGIWRAERRPWSPRIRFPDNFVLTFY